METTWRTVKPVNPIRLGKLVGGNLSPPGKGDHHSFADNRRPAAEGGERTPNKRHA
jgi:hypothetical protein